MPPRVGLFATCLMNLFRPNVGFAAVKLLETAGCTVEVPLDQTCCGQPAYNSGDFEAARALARQVIETFEGFDYVVGPSGSCMATIRKDYPRLFADDPPWRARAEALAAKSFELISFLTDVRGITTTDAAYAGSASYLDSCSGLRELDIKAQPRLLLGSAMFGIGWGLAGFCPGPALMNLFTMHKEVVIFVVSMVVGMLLQQTWARK